MAELNSTGRKIVLLIVAASCFFTGIDIFRTGEFYTLSNSGPNVIVDLDGWGAYVAGAAFLAIAGLAAFSVVRR
jgi:hypothetical protein